MGADLLKRGFNTFRALSPDCVCDLIILKNGKMYSIEVRTGHIDNVSKKLVFPTKSKIKPDIYAVVIYQNTGESSIEYLPSLPEV